MLVIAVTFKENIQTGRKPNFRYPGPSYLRDGSGAGAKASRLHPVQSLNMCVVFVCMCVVFVCM